MNRVKFTVMQLLPELDMGGVEKGTTEIAAYLVANGCRSIVISRRGRLVNKLLAGGSEHIDWDIGAKRLATLRWIPKLRKLFETEQPDIIHLRSRLPAWMAYLAWKGIPAGKRPRLVTTVHGPYSPGLYSSVMMRGERVIAVSNMIRQYILKHYSFVQPEHIRVIHRGVDPLEYPYGYQPDDRWLATWASELPQLTGKKVITLPARLSRWKGQVDFIDIIHRLKRNGHAIHGLIVGAAHRRKQGFEQELRALITNCQLDDTITMLGHRSDLKEILAISDIVLSLSTDPEAFGRTTIEALSIGTPVAAYGHGGVEEQLAEILPQGMVKVGDRATMASLLSTWLESPPRVPEKHSFTLQNMQEKTFAVYQELLECAD